MKQKSVITWIVVAVLLLFVTYFAYLEFLGKDVYFAYGDISGCSWQAAEPCSATGYEWGFYCDINNPQSDPPACSPGTQYCSVAGNEAVENCVESCEAPQITCNVPCVPFVTMQEECHVTHTAVGCSISYASGCSGDNVAQVLQWCTATARGTLIYGCAEFIP